MDEYCKSNYGLPTDVYVESHLRTGQVRFYWDFGRTCDCVTLSNANMTSTSMYLHVADYQPKFHFLQYMFGIIPHEHPGRKWATLFHDMRFNIEGLEHITYNTE